MSTTLDLSALASRVANYEKWAHGNVVDDLKLVIAEVWRLRNNNHAMSLDTGKTIMAQEEEIARLRAALEAAKIDEDAMEWGDRTFVRGNNLAIDAALRGGE